MTIKTRKLTAKDLRHDKEVEAAVCKFCGKPGNYWAQDEGNGEYAASESVQHCQRHKSNAVRFVTVSREFYA